MKLNKTLGKQLIANRISHIKKSLEIKGLEYVRNDDMMHNFNEGANLKNKIRERVIEDFSLKHEISINDMINDIENGILPDESAVIEKFGDAINYLILKEMSILHRIKAKTIKH